MTSQIRPAKPSDAIACAQIIRDWGDETPWMVPLDDLEPMAASWKDLLTPGMAWVATRGDQVVGFCVREDDNITGLYIAKSARSQGVGKRLLDLAKENRDWITVWAYALNTEALRFYRREGLVEICREPEPDSNLMNVEHRWVRPGTAPDNMP